MRMELGSPQIWIRLVEYSSSDVSGASEVPQSYGELALRSYHKSDSLKINVELKGAIQYLNTPGNHCFDTT